MTATAVILPSGETLGGFRIVDVLGLGGMAVVYRAEQLSLHREVALKVLSAELGRDEVFGERFRREGMHVSRLDHPNIIPIYDAGSDKGRLFLAMRLVDGMTLAERIRVAPMSVDETLRILGPIADGLDSAHATGLVHRDVKPQNILLTERGHPYLTDFGVAKRVDTAGMTDAGGFVGSFHYAAPEQVLGTSTSAVTDVYALTVVLYQCLTGAVPYARSTNARALFARVSEPPPRLASAEAHGFNDVLERGMARDPVERYHSAAALIVAAEQALQDLPSAYRRRRPVFSSSSALGPECDYDPGRMPGAREADTFDTAQRMPGRRNGRARHRDSDQSRSPAQGRRMRRIVAGAAGCAALGAVFTGLVLSGGGPAAASARIARSGGLAIVYRTPWTRSHAAFASSVLTPPGHARPAPIELGSDGATVVAGSLIDSSAVPGGPPPALVASFGNATRTTTRLLNGSEVARYHWMVAGRRSIDAWVIPTTRADVAIICSAPVAMGAALRACAGMATRVHVSGVPLMAVGPDVALAHSLRRVTTDAAGSRSTLTAGVRGRRGWASSTVTLVARADTRATRALDMLDVPDRYGPVISRLAATFNAEARALRTLAHADQTHDRTRYAFASAAIERASRALRTLSRQAANDGLLTTTLSGLKVPAWPAVASTRPVVSTGALAPSAPTVSTPSSTYTASSSQATTVSPSNPSPVRSRSSTSSTAAKPTSSGASAPPIH